jgi:hypothetical protein
LSGSRLRHVVERSAALGVAGLEPGVLGKSSNRGVHVPGLDLEPAADATRALGCQQGRSGADEAVEHTITAP